MRASQFLLDRVSALKNSIEFFTRGGYDQSANQRRLIFLSQIDFWDFEMDSVIYAFDSFMHRQESWGNSNGIMNGLNYNNILIKNNVLDNQNYNRSVVVAPIDELNGLIDVWNSLVDYCSGLILPEKQIQSAIECGGADSKTLKNLDKFKKVKLEGKVTVALAIKDITTKGCLPDKAFYKDKHYVIISDDGSFISVQDECGGTYCCTTDRKNNGFPFFGSFFKKVKV